MSWRVVVRPEAGDDMTEAAAWYDVRREGLGAEFREEVICVFDALAENPFLNSRRHPSKDFHWRYPERFPYRVIYEVIEEEDTVVIAAVLHAARHDRQWKRRV
jgi:plasmid stabilization system protein ParE